MYIRQLFVFCCAAVLAACGECPSVPTSEEGEYRLTAAAGGFLPAWINKDESQGSGHQLLYGSLRLRAPDQAMVVLQSRMVDARGTVTSTRSDTIYAEYVLEGTELQLDPYRSTADLWLGLTATVQANRRIDAELQLTWPSVEGYRYVSRDVRFER
jgi:hypothetical protein